MDAIASTLKGYAALIYSCAEKTDSKLAYLRMAELENPESLATTSQKDNPDHPSVWRKGKDSGKPARKSGHL